MSGDTYDQAAVVQFSQNIYHRAQQKRSRFRGTPAVFEKPVTGYQFSYDLLGTVEPEEIKNRFQATKAIDPEHSRRWGVMRPFIGTIYLDHIDEVQMLADPKSEYVEQILRGVNRTMDRVIAEAAVATVKTGRNYGETDVTAANDGVITIAHGSSGLTFDKCVQAVTNFEDNEVAIDDESYMCLAIGAKGSEDLLKEAKLTSKDYVDQTMLPIKGGRVKEAAGMEVLRFGTGSKITNPVIPVTSNIRDNIALAESAICFGISQDPKVFVDRRSDMNQLWQVQVHMYIGAVRTEGERVQIVQSDES